MKFNTVMVLLIFSAIWTTPVVRSQVLLKNCIFQPEDQRLVVEKLNSFSKEKNKPIADLVAQIGLSFLGTPYVGATLENGPEEKLVINLRELDCTTFVETCLALARTVKSGKTDFESYAAQLEQLRYRDGIRNQYPSRLHYFSEWIHNNAEKKIISEQPNLTGVKLMKPINFMSSHPEDYPVLKAHSELIPTIANQEKKLSAKETYYFPKNNPGNLIKALHHGDIIALTSGMEGIDINHVGIIIQKGNEFHLLHASLSGKKVVLSDGPITDFIRTESINSGIVIARPVL